MESQPAKFIPMLIHDTVSRSIIMIDEASLHVQISDYGNTLRRPNDFIGYALAAMSTTLALVTATFHDFGLSAHLWHSIFLLVDGALILKSITAAYSFWKQKNLKPEDVIAKIKKESIIEESSVVSMRPY